MDTAIDNDLYHPSVMLCYVARVPLEIVYFVFNGVEPVFERLYTVFEIIATLSAYDREIGT